MVLNLDFQLAIVLWLYELRVINYIYIHDRLWIGILLSNKQQFNNFGAHSYDVYAYNNVFVQSLPVFVHSPAFVFICKTLEGSFRPA